MYLYISSDSPIFLFSLIILIQSTNPRLEKNKLQWGMLIEIEIIKIKPFLNLNIDIDEHI